MHHNSLSIVPALPHFMRSVLTPGVWPVTHTSYVAGATRKLTGPSADVGSSHLLEDCHLEARTADICLLSLPCIL